MCNDPQGFIVGNHLATKVNADQKTSEDDPSCGAAIFLTTITELCQAEVHSAQFQQLDASTATTASARTAPSRGTGSRKPSRNNKITGLQRLHQLTSVLAPKVKSLTNRLNSIAIAPKGPLG